MYISGETLRLLVEQGTNNNSKNAKGSSKKEIKPEKLMLPSSSTVVVR